MPENWISCQEANVVIKPLGEHREAAIIVLPYLEKGSDHIPEELVASSAALFKEYRNKADIVIAVSSWGYFREKKFLGSPIIAETPPDIFLGSGDGPGMTGSLTAEGKTLWVRSYPTGKAVNRIDLLQWPDREAGFKWSSGENVKWFLQTLTEKVREEPAVAKLLSGISDEK